MNQSTNSNTKFQKQNWQKKKKGGGERRKRGQEAIIKDIIKRFPRAEGHTFLDQGPTVPSIVDGNRLTARHIM